MSFESVLLPIHFILCGPRLLLPSIFPSICGSNLSPCNHWSCFVDLCTWTYVFRITYMNEQWIKQKLRNVQSCQHFSSVQSLSPHESQHTRPPCPSPTPRLCSNSCPSSRWCHPAISSSVVPFSSCPQSLPASGSFPMSQLFAWGGQSTGVSASASALPKNTQDWSPLGWTGWISLQFKGHSSLLQHHSSKASISWHSAFFTVQLTSIHDHWKNHSFDQRDLCWQSNVSAF